MRGWATSDAEYKAGLSPIIAESICGCATLRLDSPAEGRLPALFEKACPERQLKGGFHRNRSAEFFITTRRCSPSPHFNLPLTTRPSKPAI